MGFLASFRRCFIACWELEVMGHSSFFRTLLMSRSGRENGQAEGSTGYEGDESRNVRDVTENGLSFVILEDDGLGLVNSYFTIGAADCIRGSV